LQTVDERLPSLLFDPALISLPFFFFPPPFFSPGRRPARRNEAKDVMDEVIGRQPWSLPFFPSRFFDQAILSPFLPSFFPLSTWISNQLNDGIRD